MFKKQSKELQPTENENNENEAKNIFTKRIAQLIFLLFTYFTATMVSQSFIARPVHELMGTIPTESVIKNMDKHDISIGGLKIELSTPRGVNSLKSKQDTLWAFAYIKKADPELFQSYKTIFPQGIQIINFSNPKNLASAPKYSTNTIFTDIDIFRNYQEDPYALPSALVHELNHTIRQKQTFGLNSLITNLPIPNQKLQTPNLEETLAVEGTNIFLKKAGLPTRDYIGIKLDQN
jgi:hypothetical protein